MHNIKKFLHPKSHPFLREIQRNVGELLKNGVMKAKVMDGNVNKVMDGNVNEVMDGNVNKVMDGKVNKVIVKMCRLQLVLHLIH